MKQGGNFETMIIPSGTFKGNPGFQNKLISNDDSKRIEADTFKGYSFNSFVVLSNPETLDIPPPNIDVVYINVMMCENRFCKATIPVTNKEFMDLWYSVPLNNKKKPTMTLYKKLLQGMVNVQ
ncbi:hypothetical protein RF11_06038 [Thelohanellus kitauei]|uniref:Uncharacterized protein n=1 Tax=Thelohanellus kitauei TaxID=669202 RepID=A0A0C2JRE5_THEKT|nr:hypothetical protein RF11_06038 [Thelohanellus kitauei]